MDLAMYPIAGRMRFLRTYWLYLGFRISFWQRLSHSTLEWLGAGRIAGCVIRLNYRCMARRCGIELPATVAMGAGIYIPHPCGIVVHPDVVLGNEVYISQGVTIGKSHRGKRKGTPTIGSRVFIGPNAVCVGHISIADRAVIAANSVVGDDVPYDAVVLGIPAKIVSYNGSGGIVPEVKS